MSHFDLSLVDWSRAQFALTAIYHWIFVPLTLGLSFIIAFMHSMYVKTNSEKWKNTTKFWMKIFGINFAIGVATGIILEFEFGTNWSNYSWFVGDIFGAPLAIEGIMAFFLESTFVAVMFFGWGRVSKKFHLLSTWLVAFGSNLSALWILVANAWMQNPVGVKFNPETVRNEMQNFWDILLSSTAVAKFLHTITNGYVVASVVVIGISAWYLLRKRHVLFAKRNILIASVFGLLSSVFLAVTGDTSAYDVAQHQPMKLAAMEGLYHGDNGVGLVAFGILNNKEVGDNKDDYIMAVKIPYALSFLSNRDFNSFVPGIEDLVYGNEKQGIESVKQKIVKGKIALNALSGFHNAMKIGDSATAKQFATTLDQNYKCFGYGYITNEKDVVPNVPITFYSFHIMVILGVYFILLFLLTLYFSLKNNIESRKGLLKIMLWSVPFAYIATEMGWIVAEVGRQPWTIQDILPTMASTSHLSVSSVQLTFWLFAVLFTVLLVVEFKIMFTQIKIGPKE